MSSHRRSSGSIDRSRLAGGIRHRARAVGAIVLALVLAGIALLVVLLPVFVAFGSVALP